MKIAIGLLVCLLITNSFAHYPFGDKQVPKDDKNTLQLMFNGLFEQGNLPDPQTIVPCFDDSSATLTVTFIGTLLQEVANNNIKGAEQSASDYGKQLPQAVKTCLGQNAEIQQAAQAYHLAGLSGKDIQNKVEKYALSHIFALHHDAVIANSHFQSGEYKQVGQEAGQIVQQIFGKNEEPIVDPIVSRINADPMLNLHQMFAGFWQQISLPDPTTPIYCFSATSAQTALDLFGKLLRQYASDNFKAASQTFDEFATQIPQNVSQCFLSDSQVVQVEAKYGISGLLPDAFQKLVAKYALVHYIDFHHSASELNQGFQAHKYQNVGAGSGRALLSIINSKNMIDE